MAGGPYRDNGINREGCRGGRGEAEGEGEGECEGEGLGFEIFRIINIVIINAREITRVFITFIFRWELIS